MLDTYVGNFEELLKIRAPVTDAREDCWYEALVRTLVFRRLAVRELDNGREQHPGAPDELVQH